MVALRRIALFDQHKSPRRTGLGVQIEDRVSSGAGTSKRIKHDPVRPAPDLDNLLEKLKRLDCLKVVASTDCESAWNIDPFGGVIGVGN